MSLTFYLKLAPISILYGMIQILSAEEIGHKERFGVPLHEEIEQMAALYESNFGQKPLDHDLVLILSGAYFYVVFSRIPTNIRHGMIDSNMFFTILSNATKQTKG